MTWLLSEACELVAVAVSVLYTFKILLRLSKENSKSNEQKSIDILKFWVIFGFLRIFEHYVEIFIRWFPFYYYFKSFLFLVICIPELKIAHLIFSDILIPTIHNIQHQVQFDEEQMRIPTPVEICLFVSSFVLLLLFPAISVNKLKSSSSTIDLNENIDVDKCGIVDDDRRLSSLVGEDDVSVANSEQEMEDGDEFVDMLIQSRNVIGTEGGVTQEDDDEYVIEDIYDEYDSTSEEGDGDIVNRYCAEMEEGDQHVLDDNADAKASTSSTLSIRNNDVKGCDFEGDDGDRGVAVDTAVAVTSFDEDTKKAIQGNDLPSDSDDGDMTTATSSDAKEHKGSMKRIGTLFRNSSSLVASAAASPLVNRFSVNFRGTGGHKSKLGEMVAAAMTGGESSGSTQRRLSHLSHVFKRKSLLSSPSVVRRTSLHVVTEGTKTRCGEGGAKEGALEVMEDPSSSFLDNPAFETDHPVGVISPSKHRRVSYMSTLDDQFSDDDDSVVNGSRMLSGTSLADAVAIVQKEQNMYGDDDSAHSSSRNDREDRKSNYVHDDNKDSAGSKNTITLRRRRVIPLAPSSDPPPTRTIEAKEEVQTPTRTIEAKEEVQTKTSNTNGVQKTKKEVQVRNSIFNFDIYSPPVNSVVRRNSVLGSGANR